MDRAQSYERDALEDLFNRNVGPVYEMAHALAGDPAVAEALTGQAFMKALDGLPGFRSEPAAFDGWVRRLAADAAHRLPPPTGGLRAALAKISRSEFEAVTLRILGGLSTAQLAATLDRPPAAVRAQIAAGLRGLSGGGASVFGPPAREGFDGALDRVIAGESSEADPSSLTGAAAALAALPRESLSPAAATRLRTTFFAAAAERRALWVHRHQRAASVPGVERRRQPNQMGTLAALVVAGVLALGVGLLLALLSSFADPDSPFYTFKRGGESVLLGVSGDPVARADLEIKIAQTRSREAEDMATKGDGRRALASMTDHFKLLRAGTQDLLRAPDHKGKRWTSARDRLLEASSQPSTQIQRDLRTAHQAAYADQIKELAERYQNERKELDARLGRSVPSPGAVIQASPQPSAAPTR